MYLLMMEEVMDMQGVYNWNPFDDAHRWRYCNS